jgi:hypothetical protein
VCKQPERWDFGGLQVGDPTKTPKVSICQCQEIAKQNRINDYCGLVKVQWGGMDQSLYVEYLFVAYIYDVKRMGGISYLVWHCLKKLIPRL